MCGIIGFITDKPTEENYSLLGDLLFVSSERGTDATGIAIAENKKIKVVKEDVPSDKFIKKHYIGLKKEIAKSNVVLGHTRLATQGHQSDNHNNHPIVGEKYVMVHNGVCSTMDRIKDYPYKGKVDSEILLSYIEKKGLKDGLIELVGSAAVAIIKEGEPNTLYLWRHNNPLWLAYDPERKVLFFGSTEDILKEGLANLLNFFSSFQMRQIPENYLYKITCSPLSLEVLGEVEPKKTYTYSSYFKKNKAYIGASGYGWGDGYDYESLESMGITGESNSGQTQHTSDTPKDRDGIDSQAFIAIYKQVGACKWDAKKKIFTSEPIPLEGISTARYFYTGQSLDFVHWTKLEGGGHVSIDKKLVKFYDPTAKKHFLMTVVDAIKEGLIDLTK